MELAKKLVVAVGTILVNMTYASSESVSDIVC